MKKMSVLAAIFAAFISIYFSGCSFGLHEVFGRPHDVDERTKNLKILSDSEKPAASIPDQFDFLVFTDIHFGKQYADRYADDLIDYITANKNSLNSILFCVCTGDLTDHGTESDYSNYRNFTQRIFDETSVKTYSTVGNHDLYNSGWKYYQNYVFPYSSFYKMEFDGISFYFIDTASGCTGKVQYDNLKNAFKNDSKKKIVFSHYPLYGQGKFYFRLQDMTERNMLVALFAQNNVTACVSGHAHGNYSTDFGAFYDLNMNEFYEDGAVVLFHVNQSTQAITWEEFTL